MAAHLVIFVKDGQVQSVVSDVQSELQCLVVSAGDGSPPHIKGEPWVKAMDFPEVNGLKSTLAPIPVTFDPEQVGKIVSMEAASKRDLLKLLR